jgi:hypothetical protein
MHQANALPNHDEMASAIWMYLSMSASWGALVEEGRRETALP